MAASSSEVEKIEMDVPIKAPAEQFFDVLCNRTHDVPNACPDIAKSVDIHEGAWGSQGSIISWNYLHGGKACFAKQLVEEIDREKHKITFKVLEGDLVEQYKSFKFIMQVVPQKEGQGSVVHWVVEYEKPKDNNNNIPNPHSLFHLSVEVLKGVDAHIIATQAQAQAQK